MEELIKVTSGLHSPDGQGTAAAALSMKLNVCMLFDPEVQDHHYILSPIYICMST